MARVLIVANETAGGRHLQDEVRRRVASGPHTFRLLVPATRPHGTATWTDGEARKVAKERMDAAIAGLTDLGADIVGEVGVAPTPFDAVLDTLREHGFDEIIVSTLPHSVSRWLRMDLPGRLARRTNLPVTHLVASAKEARKHPAA